MAVLYLINYIQPMSYNTTMIIPAKKKGKKKKDIKFDRNHLYSSFWLDRDEMWGRDLSSSGTAASSTVKVIKLRSYQRAVSNFVKILAKKEIPVIFHNGKDSFTDGKMIAITSKIDTKNFDVVVGLALHEASHILLTDFSAFKNASLYDIAPHVPIDCDHSDFKSLVNWIEDRRIDEYVFKHSPGYKAYYHKLYDHYFNQPSIGKMLRSVQYREVSFANYMAHIFNMTNSAFDPTALPGLKDIVQTINLPAISRLDSTKASIELALEVLKQIAKQTNNDEAILTKTADTGDSPVDTSIDNTDASSDTSGDTDSSDELEDLSPAEEMEINKELQKQRSFINHTATEEEKGLPDKAVQKKLDSLGNMDVDVEKVGGKWDAVIYNLTKDRQFWNDVMAIETAYNNNSNEQWYYRADKLDLGSRLEAWPNCCNYIRRFNDNFNMEQAQEAINLGNQLGKKLRLVNESRELVYNRLDKGSVDKRRISCLGYDITNVFNQTHLDSYKGANLHISIDASGSMGGTKWKSALQMAIAIAVAAKSTANKINVQISLRSTRDSDKTAELAFIYDSKVNSIDQLVRVLRLCNVNATTPEGLCFEAMNKRNLLKCSDTEMDSYFINISDGEPQMGSYSGNFAVKHTKQQVDKLRTKYNMHMLAFFVTNGGDNNLSASYAGGKFLTMYGRDARGVNPKSLVELAKTMNDKFLSAKVSH